VIASLIALLACASVNNGNPTSAGSPRDVSYGDLFASDADDGAGGGGGSDDSGSGDTGSWDTGSWDTGSWDTGGGGGDVGADGEYPGTVTIDFVSPDFEFGCYGEAIFVVSDGSYYGYGSCETEYGDPVSLAWAAGYVQISYPDFECAVTETSLADGSIASGDVFGFAGTWNLEPCDSPMLYEFEGTVAFD
jgi:hypothetical protein